MGRNIGGRDEGQSVIEFMLMLPLILFFVAALLEFGFAFYTYVTVNHAASEAARYAAVGNHPADVRGRARESSNDLLACGDVAVAYPEGASSDRGDPVTVTVDYTYETVTPAPALFSFISAGAFPTSWDISTYADARLEAAPAGSASGGC